DTLTHPSAKRVEGTHLYKRTVAPSLAPRFMPGSRTLAAQKATFTEPSPLFTGELYPYGVNVVNNLSGFGASRRQQRSCSKTSA
ncbi:MAG: hypothetical protein ACPH5V_08400, partial [Alcanivorax sp.]